MKQIKELEQKIIKASKEYYASESTISDSEFDSWINELRELDSDNTLLSTTGSGYTPVGSHLKKYPQATHIGSLSKIKKEDVIDDFEYSWHDGLIVASLKLDGGDVVLYYENGKFIKALSRGDGDIGLDISKNLLHGKSFPLTIEDKSIMAVRGQVMLTFDSFKILGGSSPRNKAVGLSQSIHSPIESLKHLKFVAFDIIQISSDSTKKMTKIDSLMKLRDLEFQVTPWASYRDWYSFIDRVRSDNISMTTKWYGSEFPDNLPADGIVLSKQTSHYTQSEDSKIISYDSVAFKFPDESKITKIKDIEFNVSRTGRIVPVLIIDEIDLSGAKINRVTANNVSWLIEKGCGIGAEVEVVRSNEVIPMIKSIVKPVDPSIPKDCPKCHWPLSMNARDLMCTATTCPTKTLTTLDRIFEFVMPDGIGQTTLSKIYEEFSITDLDSLRQWIDDTWYGEVEEVFGKGSVTAKKIGTMKLDLSHKQFSITDVLYISNIPQLGKASSQAINNGVSKENFKRRVEINFIDPAWAELMASQPAFDNLRNQFNKVRQVAEFIGWKNIYQDTPTESQLNMKITLTGALSKSRSVLVKEYKSFGFMESSIGSADLLICNQESSSSKYKKAQSRGIPILTESEFNRQYLNQ